MHFGTLNAITGQYLAMQYLCMHARACAAERNLSHWGRLYDKLRGKLKIVRAEKMVFVAFNDRAERTGKVCAMEELLFKELLDDAGDSKVPVVVDCSVA
jgi:hypothetical protein